MVLHEPVSRHDHIVFDANPLALRASEPIQFDHHGGRRSVDEGQQHHITSTNKRVYQRSKADAATETLTQGIRQRFWGLGRSPNGMVAHVQAME
jgi:hypothetical protein